jgi:beta-phosphoglucomutase-like phosphatase (HAD superfamily)
MKQMSLSPATIEPTPPYEALIFDCDGTLADTLKVHYKAWSSALCGFNARISEAFFYAHSGSSAAELVRTINRLFGYELDEEKIIEERGRHYWSHLHTVRAIEAVADVARAHHGRSPMAVASGGARAMVEATLDAIGLRALFDVVVTVDDVVRGKPAPDLFLLAACRLGVSPEGCVVYEDSDEGLEAARLAGMRSIDVRSLRDVTDDWMRRRSWE